MNTNSSARDTFLYLMALISLAASAISLGSLLFQIVNHYFPDAAIYYYGGFEGSMRYAIATLIVMFPVFLGVSRFIKRDLISNPEKGDMRVRRWLLYFTVFVASLVIIGDLIAVIFSFLDGELTIRFALKALIILGIASATFSYYLRELRWKTGMVKEAPLFFWLSSAIVLISIILGFIVVGSPMAQREQRFDLQKLSDLQMIESAVTSWWSAKGSLPTNLRDLQNVPYPTNIKDPQTEIEYKYSVKTQNPPAYVLCATFNRDMPSASSPSMAKPYPLSSNPEKWNYTAGETCFNLVIDPDFIKQY